MNKVLKVEYIYPEEPPVGSVVEGNGIRYQRQGDGFWHYAQPIHTSVASFFKSEAAAVKISWEGMCDLYKEVVVISASPVSRLIVEIPFDAKTFNYPGYRRYEWEADGWLHVAQVDNNENIVGYQRSESSNTRLNEVAASKVWS